MCAPSPTCWKARHRDCDAMVCCMSAGTIMKYTSMGRFRMSEEQKGAAGAVEEAARVELRNGRDSGKTAGERQLAMLRRLRNSCASSPARRRMCETTSDAAISHCGLRREHRQYGAAAGRQIRKRRPQGPAGAGPGRRSRRLSRDRAFIRASSLGSPSSSSLCPQRMRLAGLSDFCCCGPTSSPATPAITIG